MITFIIAVVIGIALGYKGVKWLHQTVVEELKERIGELEDENLQLLSRLNTAAKGPKVSNPKTNTEQQFTQKELIVLRNLLHPDKHKNSDKSTEMFVKVNSLIK